MQPVGPLQTSLRRPSSALLQQQDANLLNKIPKDVVHRNNESVTDMEVFFPTARKVKEYMNIPESEAEMDYADDDTYEIQDFRNNTENTEIEAVSRFQSISQINSADNADNAKNLLTGSSLYKNIYNQLEQIITEQKEQRKEIEEIKTLISKDIDQKLIKHTKTFKQMYQNQTILEQMIKDLQETKVDIIEQKLKKIIDQLKSQ